MHRFLEVFLYREWTVNDMDTMELLRYFRDYLWRFKLEVDELVKKGVSVKPLGILGNILVYFLGIFMTG